MPAPGYSLENLGNSLKIIIRCRKHWPTIIWSAAGSILVIPMILLFPIMIPSSRGSEPLVLILIVLLFIAMAVICGSILMWQLDGEEVLIIDHRKLEIKRTSFSLRGERTFTLESIKALQAMPTENDMGFKWSYLRPCSVYSYNSGRIAIEQEKRIFRVGSGLGSEEAEEIVKTIQSSYLNSVGESP